AEGGSAEQSKELPLLNDSLFNIYNETAMVTLMLEIGYSLDDVAKILKYVDITKTRFGVSEAGGMKVVNLLCKDRNAYGTTRGLEYLTSMPGDKEIMLYNYNASDAKHWSENVCWLYDCDFELLADDSIKQIIVCGERGKDYRLRLLMAGVPEDRVTYVKKPDDGVEKLKLIDNDNIFIIYGTDTIDMASRVKSKVLERIGREAVPAESEAQQ
ncbi:MAG: DUF1727 domain-containing protein, partial [Anaerovoracaceae bacterium]